MRARPAKGKGEAGGGVYRAGPIKRSRMTKAEVETLERQIIEVLADDNPQSVRHVFYRMTNPRLSVPVEKTEAGYRKVQDRVVKMRRAGTLPYGWISDTTRRGYHVSTFEGGGDLIARFAGLYRAPVWDEADSHVEVWCESRSIAGVVERDCRELAVSLYPTGGFSSMTLAYQAAEGIRADVDRTGKDRAVVVYVGDYDPAGVLIDVAVERELRAHLPGVDLVMRRIAINEDQIEAFDLPAKPRKETERRRRDIHATVEAEAMPAGTLRGLLRDAVESYLPAGALDAVKVAEESERAGLRRLAEAVSIHGLDDVVEVLA